MKKTLEDGIILNMKILKNNNTTFKAGDIVKITYGKNTIYEDKNFKEKLLEEENEIAR